VSPSRRHRLIWTAVGCIHLAALAGVVVGGRSSGAVEAPVGGLILVHWAEEPMGLPGEAKQGPSVGAGSAVVLPVPVAAVPVPSMVVAPSTSVSVPAPVVPQRASADAVAPSVAVAPAPVFVAPQFKVRPEPAYPERARRAGVEGHVVVRLRISAGGEVVSAQVAESSGSASLDASALAAARASTFTPASAGDRPVASEASATYRFELR
jgi:protein TonB